MNKMNIWFFSPHEQPHAHASRTFDFSHELVKRGHKVSVFTNSYTHRTHEDYLREDEKWRIENIEGIQVVWLKTYHYTGNGWKRGVNMLSYAKRCLHAAKKIGEKPDVVVGDSVPPSAGWAAMKIAESRNAALVYQVRDVWPIALVYDGGLTKKNPIYYAFRMIEKRLYRKSQRICATMPFLKEHVRESGGDPKKVTWIPNGVNLERYSSVKPYDGGNKLPLTAMYVGGFGIAHDVINIVRAAKILKEKRNTKYRFVLVGDGVKRSDCIKEAASEGLTNIEFRECIPKKDVPQLQAEADILIACVTDSESYRFGLNLNKLFDYFASGKPVIFSGNSPNDPVAESGGGFSIPPEDPNAMATALEKFEKMTTKERAELGHRARNYAEKEFDVCKHAEKMEKLLQQAVRDKKLS